MVAGEDGQPPWQEKFVDLLGALLTAAADNQELEAASRELQEFVADEIAASWPLPEVQYRDLEVWGPDTAPGGQWSGAVLGKRRRRHPAGVRSKCELYAKGCLGKPRHCHENQIPLNPPFSKGDFTSNS